MAYSGMSTPTASISHGTFLDTIQDPSSSRTTAIVLNGSRLVPNSYTWRHFRSASPVLAPGAGPNGASTSLPLLAGGIPAGRIPRALEDAQDGMGQPCMDRRRRDHHCLGATRTVPASTSLPQGPEYEEIMDRTPASSLASPTPMECRRPVPLAHFWSKRQTRGPDHDSAASSALASCRSTVSKPSVNQS